MTEPKSANSSSATIEAYKDLIAVSSENLAPIQTTISQLPGRKHKLKAKFERIRDTQRDSLDLIKQDFTALETAARADDSGLVLKYALRIGSAGIALAVCFYEAKLLDREINLEPAQNFISDERIREVIKDPRYGTRSEQAKELGYKNSRSLNKRLEKLQD